MPRRLFLLTIVLIATTAILAQQWRRGRSAPSQRSDYPQWEIDKQFRHDVFTFARVEYDSYGRGRGGGWRNDYPDCDWNFSARLQELTSFQVDPNGTKVRLDDPRLTDFPFLYISNCNTMQLGDDEVAGLRRYLLNGGFLMADDFWGPDSWAQIQQEMTRVLPGRKPVELSLEHPIFHMVYDLAVKPQVPSIFAWRDGYTYEYWHWNGPALDTEPHFMAYLDDRGHIMALMCHNNDIGDGWEREGEEKEFFLRYSEKVSYPLGINIVTYAMTH